MGQASAAKGSITRWDKAIACLVVLCFLGGQNSWALGLPASPEAQRDAASVSPAPAFSPAGFSDLSSIEIPESVGKIKSAFQGTKDKVFIHIQDAHLSESAQLNIAKILEIFSDRYGLKRVHVEGAEGTVYPQFLSFFPDRQIRKAVSEFLMREGRLSGPEYLAVVEQKNIRLEGIEDKGLYEANREAYLEAAERAPRDLRLLESLGKILKNLPQFIFSEELFGLYQSRSRFDAGGGELISYVKALMKAAQTHSVSLAGYRELDSFQKLITLEREIDFQSASEQIERLTQDLKKVVSRQRLSQFLTNTVQFRMSKMRRSEYYGYLRHEIDLVDSGGSPAGSRVPLKAQYDSVLKYLEYMQLYDQIGVTLFDELERLESEVKESMFQKQEERDLDQLLHLYKIYHSIFSFELTKQDAEYFYAHRDEFKAERLQMRLQPFIEKFHFEDALPAGLEDLDRDLPRVERFYELALARDPILIQNAIRSAEKDDQTVSAIVTGGFHTPGIERYLREQGYSYLVLTPSLSGDADLADEKKIYERAMARKPIALEEVLIPETMEAKSARIQDPRFQLAAGTSLVTSETLQGFLGLMKGDLRSEVRQALQETAPTYLGMNLGRFLTVIESGGTLQAQRRMLGEITQHSEWPSALQTALSEWVSEPPVYISDPEKNTHRLYFRMQGPEGPQFYMLFTGASEAAAEFRNVAQIRQTFLNMRALVPIGDQKRIVWAAHLGADHLPQEAAAIWFKGMRLQISEKTAIQENSSPQTQATPRAEVLPVPDLMKVKPAIPKSLLPNPPAAAEPDAVISRQPAVIQNTMERKSGVAKPMLVPAAEIESPKVEAEKAEISQAAYMIGTLRPLFKATDAPLFRLIKSLVFQNMVFYCDHAEAFRLWRPIFLSLISSGNPENYIQDEWERTQRFQRLLGQAFAAAGQWMERLSQAGSPALFTGWQIAQNSSGLLKFREQMLANTPLSLEALDRKISDFLWMVFGEISAKIKSKWTGEAYVAVTRSRTKAPALTAQQRIVKGIESAQDMDFEGILRAMALANPASAYLDQNIANTLLPLLQEAAGFSPAAQSKDEPGVLIYEWDPQRSYRAQAQFLLQDWVYILNTQRSELRIVLPLENPKDPQAGFLAASLDQLLDVEGLQNVHITQGKVEDVILNLRRPGPYQDFDLVLIQGMGGLLDEFEKKNKRMPRGPNYALAAFAPRKILVVTEKNLQDPSLLGAATVITFSNILEEWRVKRAAEIAA